MARSKKLQPLITRTVSDPNFAHVLRLFPLTRMWCGGVEPGHRFDHGDRNLVQIPVEIAEALIRERATRNDHLGNVCRDVVAAIDGGDPALAIPTITNAEAAEGRS